MKSYNTLTTAVFIVVLVLSSLACGQIATTPTATVVTPSPSATASPVRTATAEPTLDVLIPGGPTIARVLAAAVNIRSKPGGEVVGQLYAGQEVTIFQCVGDWCQIADPAGWIFAGCLSDVGSDLGCEAAP